MHVTTQGIVLRAVNYKESDKILTVLTQELGKLTVSARASRKKGGGISAAAQMLVWSEMTLYEYRQRWGLKEAVTNREFRVAMANPKTGGVEMDEILGKIDKDTLLLSVMSASNISGYIFDIETIVKEARKINPNIYVISDAVQHAPHGVLDVEKCGLDGVNFAPYKMFGIRGCGYGYVSDRVAKMTHHKLLAKPEKEWELGTFPHPNYAAITAVVDYVCWIGRHFTDSEDRREQFAAGMTRIHLQEHSLLIHMMEGTD